MKRSPAPIPDPRKEGPRSRRPSSLDDDVADGHEHGERADATPREDELLGTSGSHTATPDARAEEPFGEASSVDEASVT